MTATAVRSDACGPGSGAGLGWEARNPVASELERLAPSPALVARLVELDPATSDDDALVEGIAGWERVLGWGAGAQARWVAALTDRARSGSIVDRVPDEIALRLGITRRAAEGKAMLAAGLRRHPQLAEALEAGALSARKAEVLLHDVEHLPRTLADAVLGRVLGSADERTVPQLRSDVREAELALDAEAAAARHAVARRDRGVRMVPAPDAMAWIHALLPAVDASTVMTALDGCAGAREAGDERSADQRRADALSAMARRVLDSGLGPDGAPLPVRQHRRPHLIITVPDEGAAPAGAGRSGVGSAGVGPAGVGRSGAGSAGVGSAGAGPAGVRPAGRRAGRERPGPVAHLAGYGLVPYCAVESLIDGAEQRHVHVDDDGVPVVSVEGTAGYRPSAELARQVVERDRCCRFPGCRVPAERCDIDHVVPFDPNRPARWQTIEQNLQALCRHHHRVKTHGGWSVSRDPLSGATLWRSPVGQVRIVSPDPVLPASRSG